MQTIKIQRDKEGQSINYTDGEITVLREGDHEYMVHCLTLEKEHKEAMDLCSPQRPYQAPRAIIYYQATDSFRTCYLYDDDRAWIMNANGKTVASV